MVDTAPAAPGNDNEDALDPNDVIEKLRRLKHESDPAGGDETARDKHGRAVAAIQLAWALLEQEVGWALDHCAGLCVGAEEKIYRVNFDELEKDAHEHQLRAWAYDADDPKLRRRAIMSAFMALPETPRSRLLHELMDALAGLEHGFVSELVAPEENVSRRGRKRHPLNIHECCLAAREYYEFRVDAGMAIEDARTAVMNAYGIEKSAFSNWENYAQETYGAGNYKKRIERARHAGKAYLESGGLLAAKKDEEFGDEALEEDGRFYMSVREKRKKSKK